MISVAHVVLFFNYIFVVQLTFTILVICESFVKNYVESPVFSSEAAVFVCGSVTVSSLYCNLLFRYQYLMWEKFSFCC